MYFVKISTVHIQLPEYTLTLLSEQDFNCHGSRRLLGALQFDSSI